jgi:NADH:ubiquinone oxidoreductase subunit E
MLLKKAGIKPGSLIFAFTTYPKNVWLYSGGSIKKISEELNVPVSEVAGIIGFYSFFSTTPKGKYVVRVCRALHVMLEAEMKYLMLLKMK